MTQREGQVRVAFDDATTAAYDLVVGADGIHSTVRHSIAGGTPGPVYGGQMVWRSVAAIRPQGLDGVQFWLGDDRFFGLCPTGDGTTYGFGTIAGPRRNDPVAGRKRRLAEHFAAFGAPVREYLAAIAGDGDNHCSPIEWLPDVVRHDGRIVLIGDAAHAMSPMMGQGGCMAIEDACTLAEELRRAADIPSALRAFTRRRRSRVAWVREQSGALGELVRRPAEIRDRALRERGAGSFRDRFEPLIAMP